MGSWPWLGGGPGAACPMSKSAQVGAGEIAGRGAAKQPAWHKHAATPGIAGATYAAGLDLQLTKLAVQLVRWSLSTLRMAGAAECASRAPPPVPSPLWEKQTHRAMPVWVSGLVAICMDAAGAAHAAGAAIFKAGAADPQSELTARRGPVVPIGMAGLVSFADYRRSLAGVCLACVRGRACGCTCAMVIQQAQSHPDKPAFPHCAGPRWVRQTNWALPCPPAHARQSLCPTAGYIGRCASEPLRVALNLATGEHTITSINPQVPTAKAPCWLWQTK